MVSSQEPQSVTTITELMLSSSAVVSIHPDVQELLTLITMVEGATARLQVFQNNANDDAHCPAMEKYEPQWKGVTDRILEMAREVNDIVKEHIKEIEVISNNFEYYRIRTIATCPRDECNDSKAAQEELGWKDGKEVTQ